MVSLMLLPLLVAAAPIFIVAYTPVLVAAFESMAALVAASALRMQKQSQGQCLTKHPQP